MPRCFRFAARTTRVGGSVFEQFAPRLRALDEPVYKLHIGDSHEEPSPPLAVEAEFRSEHPYWFQYPNTYGMRRLREALAGYHVAAHGWPTKADEILVTAGATNALSVIVQSIVEEGEEVLVLAPSWPFFRGMVRVAGGVVREIDVYTEASTLDPDALVARLRAAHTERSVALYVNTPNNPSGRMLDAAQRAAVLRFARENDLWVISDEAYDGMAYEGRATPPLALEDTEAAVLSVYTFSKMHRAAGLRLGWIRAPHDQLDVLDRILVHQVYSPSALSQDLVVDAVKTRPQWQPRVLAELEDRRRRFLDALDLPVEAPQGTYFCFFDASAWLGPTRDYDALITACLDAGVAVAPGGDFGDRFASWMRVCFAADAPERCEEAARRLRRILA